MIFSFKTSVLKIDDLTSSPQDGRHDLLTMHTWSDFGIQLEEVKYTTTNIQSGNKATMTHSSL